jgi:hypothetical protein
MLPKLTYCRSLVLSGAVRLEYLETTEMTADVLSKPLHGATYYKHTGRMMGDRWSKTPFKFGTISAKRSRSEAWKQKAHSAKRARTRQ